MAAVETMLQGGKLGEVPADNKNVKIINMDNKKKLSNPNKWKTQLSDLHAAVVGMKWYVSVHPLLDRHSRY